HRARVRVSSSRSGGNDPRVRRGAAHRRSRVRCGSHRSRAREDRSRDGSDRAERAHGRLRRLAASARGDRRDPRGGAACSTGAGGAAAPYVAAAPPLPGHLPDTFRARQHPDGIVSYIIDRNVNYTSVCVARCNFCAFYRPVGSSEGYVLGFDEIFRKIDETIAVGGVQVLLQGGHNPDLPLEWYEDLFRAVKQRYPEFRLPALSPPEAIQLSRLSRLPVPAVIARLMAAGLDSIPGGGAEILVDRVRAI